MHQPHTHKGVVPKNEDFNSYLSIISIYFSCLHLAYIDILTSVRACARVFVFVCLLGGLFEPRLNPCRLLFYKIGHISRADQTQAH